MAEEQTQRRPSRKGDVVRERTTAQTDARATGEYGDLIRAGRVDVYVRLGGSPWEWPAHALVVPVGPKSEPGGFAKEVLGALGKQAHTLAEAIGLQRAVAPEHPHVLHPSFGLENHFILATAHYDADGPPTQPDNARIAARAVAELAAERNYSWVVLPLIGSGASGMDSVQTALAMLQGLQEADTKGRKVAVTLFTLVQAAQQALLDRRASRPQRVFNDLAQGRDLLGVESEAHALMSTLLLADVQPPIVAGILGGWGEGKSFVMHLMKQRMREIRAMSVGTNFPWIGHSYAIEFDAWTFAKDDLWASLLQQIFTQLGEQLSVETWLREQQIPDEIAARLIEPLSRMSPATREAVLATKLDAEHVARLEGVSPNPRALWDHIDAQHQVHREKLAAETSQLDAEREEISKETEALRRKATTRVALERLAAEQLGIDLPALTKRIESRATKGGVLDRLGDWWAVFKDRWGRILVLTAVVAVVFWFLSDYMSWIDQVQAWGTGIAAAATLVLNLWGRANKWFTELRQVVQGMSEEDTEKVERLYATLVAESASLRTKQAQLLVREARVAELQSNTGLARFRSIVEFVNDRLGGAEYEQRLGSLHRVQQDLRQLTECLVIQEGDPHAEAKRLLFPRGAARVILFIDDLDRCPPTRVVEVFEAVQLLVKTELFVVVIAMDERYVTRSLEKQYAGILSQHIRPTGLDYIEKIIQIPYRVRQVNATALAGYLADQMDLRVEDVETVEEEKKQEGSRAGEPGKPSDVQPGPTPANIRVAEPAPVVDLPSRVLMFERYQFEVLTRCCARLELSPRSSKRLVNVYKLLKILWFDERPHRAPGKDVEEIVIALVSLSAFYPAGARRLLRALDEAQRDAASTFASVLDNLRKEPAPTARRVRDWIAMLTAAGELLPGAKPVHVLPEMTLDLVVSFSFIGDLDEVDTDRTEVSAP